MSLQILDREYFYKIKKIYTNLVVFKIIFTISLGAPNLGDPTTFLTMGKP